MGDIIFSSPLFGLALTCAAWCLGLWAQRRTGSPFLNPLLVAVAAIVLVLVVLRVPLEDYDRGGSLISMMLEPVTAVLALNVYRLRALLKEHFVPVVAGCLAGCLTSMGSVYLLCRLLAVDSVITASLLPKSVTSAIAMAISDSGGGIQSITIASVLVTGVVGAVFAPHFAKLFHITDPVAEGAAIGACSHALGTAKALEIGQLQGAMSSISLCVCGIITSVLALFFR